MTIIERSTGAGTLQIFYSSVVQTNQADYTYMGTVTIARCLHEPSCNLLHLFWRRCEA
jgi:hypothetical protein